MSGKIVDPATDARGRLAKVYRRPTVGGPVERQPGVLYV